MELYESVKSKITRGDQGVSPVIAVILMVAITVVLAATVYVWVSGFASDTEGPENANVRAQGYESSGGSTDFVRLTLTAGDGAPYAISVVSLEVIDDTGTVLTDKAKYLCAGPAAGTAGECTTPASEDWGVGNSLFVPCQGDGTHQITVTISGSTVLDTSIGCDEQADTSTA